jgi:hypothetical protein
MWKVAALASVVALWQRAEAGTTVFSYLKPSGEGGALLASYAAKWNLTALSPGGEAPSANCCSGGHHALRPCCSTHSLPWPGFFQATHSRAPA